MSGNNENTRKTEVDPENLAASTTSTTGLSMEQWKKLLALKESWPTLKNPKPNDPESNKSKTHQTDVPDPDFESVYDSDLHDGMNLGFDDAKELDEGDTDKLEPVNQDERLPPPSDEDLKDLAIQRNIDFDWENPVCNFDKCIKKTFKAKKNYFDHIMAHYIALGRLPPISCLVKECPRPNKKRLVSFNAYRQHMLAMHRDITDSKEKLAFYAKLWNDTRKALSKGFKVPRVGVEDLNTWPTWAGINEAVDLYRKKKGIYVRDQKWVEIWFEVLKHKDSPIECKICGTDGLSTRSRYNTVQSVSRHLRKKHETSDKDKNDRRTEAKSFREYGVYPPSATNP